MQPRHDSPHADQHTEVRSDTERLVEKHVSRHNTGSTSDVHIRDAQDYLEAIYPAGQADRTPVTTWLTIRTDNERRAKYDTPIEIRPLLLALFNTPGLDYEFIGKGSAIFNELFIGYEREWKAAIESDLKGVELKEASCFGMRIVLNPKSRAPWVKSCPISVTRLPHLPEEAHEYFGKLGLDTENDMIFVRKGAPSWMRADFMNRK
jgi:hypothetical protein